jgi:hypothetical protein
LALRQSSLPTLAGPRPPLLLKNFLFETTTSVRLIIIEAPVKESNSDFFEEEIDLGFDM